MSKTSEEPQGRNPRAIARDWVERAHLAMSVFSGLAYLVAQAFPMMPGSLMLKGLSVGLLAVVAFRASRTLGRELAVLGAALAFGFCGDILLELDPDRLFVYGLLSFLIGHLAYIALFVRLRRSANSTGSVKTCYVETLLSIAVLMLSAGVCLLLWPDLGGLALAVLVYVAAITTMAITAIRARLAGPWVALGAILFLISDSLLALGKFRAPVPMSGYFVWGSYYAGQLAITMGVLRAFRPRRGQEVSGGEAA